MLHRASRAAKVLQTTRIPRIPTIGRTFSSAPVFAKGKKDTESPGASISEGQFARTDESVKISYPPESEIPAQPVPQGRGGMHYKRTLAQFSLEDKVSLVTGGAQGLGLVMAQALVASGSDLAIVDLNRMSTSKRQSCN